MDNTMTLEEKVLYHQIHPLKLLTDLGAGILALYPLWGHHLALALVVMLIPPPIASFILIRYTDLKKYKASSFGKYVRKYMTRPMEMVRLAGYVLMAVGAWDHIVWMIPAGLLVVLFGWLRGVIFPAPSA